MGDDTISGGCQCGAVRYEISGPLENVAHCHCSMCRKLHGALFASFGDTDRDRMTIRGEENLDSYESSPGLARRFCRFCGGQIAVVFDRAPNGMAVALGSLDPGQSPGHDPASERHIFWESKVPWYDPADGKATATGYGG